MILKIQPPVDRKDLPVSILWRLSNPLHRKAFEFSAIDQDFSSRVLDAVAELAKSISRAELHFWDGQQWTNTEIVLQFAPFEAFCQGAPIGDNLETLLYKALCAVAHRHNLGWLPSVVTANLFEEEKW